MADLTLAEELTPEEWFQRLSVMFYAPTRPHWADRLPRPSTIVNVRDTAHGISGISRYWTPRNRYLDTLWSYYVGDPPMPQLEPEYHDVFRHVIRKARSNYAPMCIAAMLDRMELQAISTLDDSDADGDDLAAEIMEETGFVALSKEMFGHAFTLGESYAMVVPGGPGSALLPNGKPCPSIHAIDPRRCIGVPDWRNPSRLAAAVVHQYDQITWQYRAFLFLPGEKWTLHYEPGTSKWNIVDVVPETIEGLDDLGGIPIVRLDNLNGLGEYEPHLDLLDRINDTTLQRIIGFWYQALRQRALRGDEDEEDQDSPEESEPIDWQGLFKAGPGALWRIPKDFDLIEMQQADFSPLLNGKRDDVKEFAAVSSTPLHLITPDAADGSAEGAGLMRESLTSKVRDRRARLTPSLKLLWRIVFAMAGEEQRGRRMRLHWGPIEFHTLIEQATASAQAQGTLSTEDRCERIWDMSPDETERNITRLTAERLTELPPVASQPPTQTSALSQPPQPPIQASSGDSAE